MKRFALALLVAAPAAEQTPIPDCTQDAAWLCRPGRTNAYTANQDVTVIGSDGTRRIERFRAAAKPASTASTSILPYRWTKARTAT